MIIRDRDHEKLVRLINAPAGVFEYDGYLVLKTEYFHRDSFDGTVIPDCFLLESGEYFVGDAATAKDYNHLLVRPVQIGKED